jgi:ubiquinone/menaquinone biosynthesis C-methylase UbiE
VLEVGGGLGTDLAQFARHGALVTDFDLSAGHLTLARENFALRGLPCEFFHGDAEALPFDDDSFDVIYSNGVIHHTPNTQRVIEQMHRVLRPGGRIIVMVYAENSWNYWKTIVGNFGLRQGMLDDHSVGDLMSQLVEMTANDARPLVKVYTARQLHRMFGAFRDRSIVKRQLTDAELPRAMQILPVSWWERAMGWNLIIKGVK